MGGVSREIALAALRLAAYKLPVKTKIIEKIHNMKTKEKKDLKEKVLLS